MINEILILSDYSGIIMVNQYIFYKRQIYSNWISAMFNLLLTKSSNNYILSYVLQIGTLLPENVYVTALANRHLLFDPIIYCNFHSVPQYKFNFARTAINL